MIEPEMHRVDPDQLRWRCDPAAFTFETTTEVDAIKSVVGQDVAVESLRFGMMCRAHGQNVFVRGISGTGRMTLIRSLLEEINPSCLLTEDRVYVHNFVDPMRPRLLTLPRGRGSEFAAAVDRVIAFIQEDLGASLESEPSSGRRKALEDATEKAVKEAAKPVEERLAADDLALVRVASAQVAMPAIFPRFQGEPVPLPRLAAEKAKGNVTPEEFERVVAAIKSHEAEVLKLQARIVEIMRAHFEESGRLVDEQVRLALRPLCDGITTDHPQPGVAEFLQALLTDLVEHQLPRLAEDSVDLGHYRVNPILARGAQDGCPTIVENSPNYSNLMGGIDRRVVEDQLRIPDHMSIRKGSLLDADGGFLILEARDVIAEPGTWRALLRTLRTGRLEITPPELPWATNTALLKPDPIDIEVKVVMLGDSELFYLLEALDEDFGELFKVVAEFDSVIPRNEEGALQYAAVIKRIVDEDGLPAVSRGGVAALVEHGARIAASAGKLTARFSRMADVTREAGFLARQAGRQIVEAGDVTATVARMKQRADLNSRRFRELLANGVIRIETQGSVVGQVNGLAVMHSGPLLYGFPARITASIGPGSAGVVNIELESALSGAIHTKGFYILAGLLRNLLESAHPLTFEAAIAFEQSYGGIDGDSASAAEMCCLMSALTRVPIRQDLAMTGAIDQLGHIQAVGGVNEKIEGFFDTCNDRGLSTTQGVIIPRCNVGDLMLREDLVEAARAGKFHVHAVSTIGEAMELLMGRPLRGEGSETLLELARTRSREFWEQATPRSGS